MAYVERQYTKLSDFPKYGNKVYLNQRISRTGAYQCFCKISENHGVTFKITTPTSTIEEVEICPSNFNIFGINVVDLVISQCLSLIIVLLSLFYRTIYSTCIRCMGCSSRALQTIGITEAVVFVFWLNYSYLWIASPFYY